MPGRAQFRIQHVAAKPRGWRVRTKTEGAHELRIAFPPGPRRTGSGKLLEILHPKGERNPKCGLAGKNPMELIIFGNPGPHKSLRRDAKRNAGGGQGAAFAAYNAGAMDAKAGRPPEPKQWEYPKAYIKGYRRARTPKKNRELTVPEKHQIAIAKQTLKMPDAMVGVMGGMTKEQARELLHRLGVSFKENPRGKAKLTPEQNRVWEKAFQFHVDAGKSDSQADRAAWRDVAAEFPELKKFRGATPNPLRRRNRTGVKPGAWVHTPGRTEVYRVAEMQGGPGAHRYLLEGPYPSKARVWTRGGNLYLAAAPNPSRRQNQGGAAETDKAVRVFQTFQGRDPAGIVEKHISAKMREDYAALGNLNYLVVRNGGGENVKIDFEGDRVLLASSPDATQLYCIGGNQNLESCLGEFTDDPSKDLLDLGEILEVEYLTRKAQGNFEPVQYFHKFGEERRGSEMPRAIYDKLRKQVFFAGGEYKIEQPGIIN